MSTTNDDLDLFEDESAPAGNSSEEKTSAIPAKYKGKTVEEVIGMHQNAERMLGKQSAEVASLRRIQRLEEQANERQTTQIKTQERQPVTVENLLNDPDKALKSAIDNSDLVRRTEAAEARAARVEARIGERDFVTKYPTFKDDMEDPEFTAFIQRNVVRKDLADAAAKGNYDAANNLWDMWTERKELVTPKGEEKKAVRKVPDAIRSTSKDGQSQSRKFSRAKIGELREKAESGDIAAKQRWNSKEFQQELGQAYSDGRVV